MFPWYSGTSADMYRTIFGLVVSLKLFLGRFDMRTMQVAASHAFLHAFNVHSKLSSVTQHITDIFTGICCQQHDSADLTLSWPS